MEKSPSRWWDLPSAALFILAILACTWRLTITGWTDNLGTITNLAMTGALVGLALGASRFKKRGVRLLAWGYTLALAPRQLIATYSHNIYLGERLAGLGGRLLFSIQEIAADRPVEDPIFFLFLVGALYWGMALVSSYQLARHNNTLAALLPSGLALLVIHQFDRGNPQRIWLVAIYLFAALALIGRGKYLRDRAAWLQRGVHLTTEAGPNLTTSAMIGAAMLIMLTWSLPLDLSRAPALEEKWKQAMFPWRGARDRFSRAFDALKGEAAAGGENFRRTLPLGNSAALSNVRVLVVRVPAQTLDLPRLYWRARVYDHYQNGDWSLTDSSSGSFSPTEGDLPIPDRETRNIYEFSITSYTSNKAVLALPAQPISVSRPVDVNFFPIAGGKQDVLALESFPYLEPGETYHARAAIANPSIEELRAAGEDYPAWVTDHYLQLPEDFSNRMRNFASQSTLGKKTPYDKAQAITSALRARIQYQPNVPPPPKNTNLLEWFLFDVKQGYCNYYATVEVLLLRSLGIPARMAVGFSQGEAIRTDLSPREAAQVGQEFKVTYKNMHAWPEVYFPGIGWVEFEPTGNQFPLVRPQTHRTDLGAGAPPISVPRPERNPHLITDEETPGVEPSAIGFDWKPVLTALLWSAAVVLLAAAWILANRKFALTTRVAEFVLAAAEKRGERFPAWARNAALYSLADPYERAFHIINVDLRWLGKSPAPHHTPAERAAALKSLLPDSEAQIEILLKEYQSAQYSKRSGNLYAARRASRNLLWQGLRAFVGRRG